MSRFAVLSEDYVPPPKPQAEEKPSRSGSGSSAGSSRFAGLRDVDGPAPRRIGGERGSGYERRFGGERDSFERRGPREAPEGSRFSRDNLATEDAPRERPGFRPRGGDRFGDRGDRFGDRGDRFGDRGDRFGDRGDRGDRFGDRGERRYEREPREDRYGGSDRFGRPEREPRGSRFGDRSDRFGGQTRFGEPRERRPVGSSQDRFQRSMGGSDRFSRPEGMLRRPQPVGSSRFTRPEPEQEGPRGGGRFGGGGGGRFGGYQRGPVLEERIGVTNLVSLAQVQERDRVEAEREQAQREVEQQKAEEAAAVEEEVSLFGGVSVGKSKGKVKGKKGKKGKGPKAKKQSALQAALSAPVEVPVTALQLEQGLTTKLLSNPRNAEKLLPVLVVSLRERSMDFLELCHVAQSKLSLGFEDLLVDVLRDAVAQLGEERVIELVPFDVVQQSPLQEDFLKANKLGFLLGAGSVDMKALRAAVKADAAAGVDALGADFIPSEEVTAVIAEALVQRYLAEPLETVLQTFAPLLEAALPAREDKTTLQVQLLTEAQNQWYAEGAEEGVLVGLFKALHRLELVHAQALCDWRDSDANNGKSKMKALFEPELSDWLIEIDPMQFREVSDAEPESDLEDDDLEA